MVFALKVTLPDGTEYRYEYDTKGNLPSTPNQQYEYTYGGATATWKDQLTGYNGETITYDGVGNPLTYRNGMVKDGTSATYKYNSLTVSIKQIIYLTKCIYGTNL